jgi:hypothetical protein
MDYVWPALIVIAIAAMLAVVLRWGMAASRRAELRWNLRQVARAVAQNYHRPETDVLAELHAGRLPVEVRSVVVTYEPVMTRSSGQKTLRIEFAEAAAASMTVKCPVAWMDLPDDVRAEYIRSRKPITRPLTLSPQAP